MFTSFLIIGLVITYFNDKLLKNKNEEFAKKWKSEVKENKTIYIVRNVVFIVLFFGMLYILSHWK